MAARPVGRKDPRPEPQAAAPAERRRSLRFAVMVRVDYAVGGRGTFSHTSNLSTRGAFLRGATRLEVGQELPVQLRLKTEPAPVSLDAVVRHAGGGAAGLEFLPGQDQARAAIHRFIEEEVIAKLEATLERSVPTAAQVDLLADYHVEIGRPDEAVVLFQRALQTNPTPALQEGLGRLLLARVRVEEPEGAAALAELEGHVHRALLALETPALLELRDQAAELRGTVERLAREAALEQAQRRKGEEKERQEKLRAALERELDARLEEEREVLRGERRDLAAAREALAGRAAELAAGERALAEERAALEAMRVALDARAQALAAEERRVAELAQAPGTAREQADA